MIIVSDQIEELRQELKKLFTIKGRWMKNIWIESAILASWIVFLFGMLLLWSSIISTTPLPHTETPLQRTIDPDMSTSTL